MNDCLFCKMIAKEIPSEILYEDEACLVILDIHPVNPGHALVIPKQHSVNMLDADVATLQSVIVMVQKAAHAVMAATHAEGFNLHQNNGTVSGQAIPHLHFHIIPRHAEDGLKHWHGQPYEGGSASEIADKIRKAFAA